MADPDGLTTPSQNEGQTNPYGYQPQLYVCVIFVILFSFSTFVHIGQAVWKRKWFLLPTIVLGGCGEIIGWSARLWSSKNVYNSTPFLMQISTTIIAPTFLAAANFIILGTIINHVGAQYSRLPATYYAIIFVTIDLIALVVQAIGGGMASAALQKANENPDKGGHIMLVGIVIQLVETIIYVLLAIEFFSNYAKRKPARSAAGPVGSAKQPPPAAYNDRTVVNSPSSDAACASEKGGVLARSEARLTGKMRLMSVGLAFSTLTLLIRAVYRTIELSNGWSGRIIHTQVYFNVLDGAMIVLAMYTLNFIHPGFLL